MRKMTEALVRSTCPPEAEQWGMWQCTWPVATPPANPFDVELLIELRSYPPASRNVTVRGFYDGDGMFRARFMPPVVGAWSWRTLCDTVSELHAQVGNLTVAAPRQATRNHGPVQAAGHGSTKFAYADGTPWHSVGTTVYGLAGSSWGSTPANTSATLETLRGRGSVFNKVRMMVSPNSDGDPRFVPYERHNGILDLSRFNVVYWQHLDSTLATLLDMDVQADLILFNVYDKPYPTGLECLGGQNSSTYNVANDSRYLRYVVSRLAAYRNVWWSLANEWDNAHCKWQRPKTPAAGGLFPITPGAAAPAYETPIGDTLFRTLSDEDPYGHLTSLHNDRYLYNLSQPWITHYSIQHVHNRPADIWRIFGQKPFVWDEVKYEGDLPKNWGSLTPSQMVDKFWWGAACGAYAGHGEVLTPTQWSGVGGSLFGESPLRIGWFRNYITNTTLHPPFAECDGSDDGFVQTLRCGDTFHLFRFYHGRPFLNGSFDSVILPVGQYQKDLIDVWRMRIAPTTEVQTVAAEVAPPTDLSTAATAAASAPPGWAAIPIEVNDDSLPHITTFTRIGVL